MDRFPIQPWMTAAPVRRVLAALGAPAVDARFVGGCVRDAVMGRAVADIDLGTPEEPARVLKRLEDAGVKAVVTGLDHGTITALADGIGYEVTSLRRDTACDGRHAAVEFTADWHEDARRRDFTFNAMSLTPDGRLFDDHGGREDARAGHVRFVGDPADRIKEDYLRILRLFRFQAQVGRVPIDAATLAACRDNADGLMRLSAERIHQELRKLLAAPDPVPAVRMMADSGVLARVLPEVGDVAALSHLIAAEKHAAGFPPDWLRRLAALVPGAKQTARTCERLKCSNAERDRLEMLAEALPVLRADDNSVHRALYELGAAMFADRVLLAWARQHGESRGWQQMLEAAAAWTPKTFPLSGADVLALGLKPGRQVGRLLRMAEDWWIGRNFSPSRAEALVFLQSEAAKAPKE